MRNVQEQREGELVADALLRLRRQARDIALQRLSRESNALLAAARLESDVLAALVDHALLDERALDRRFWLNALAAFVNDAPVHERDERYRNASRCIHSTFRADPRRRQNAVRVLAERLVPLA